MPLNELPKFRQQYFKVGNVNLRISNKSEKLMEKCSFVQLGNNEIFHRM